MAPSLMRRRTSNLAMFHPDKLLNEVFLGTVPWSLPTPVHHIHTLRDHAADQKTDGHDAEHSPGGQRRDPRHVDRLGLPRPSPNGTITATSNGIEPISRTAPLRRPRSRSSP